MPWTCSADRTCVSFSQSITELVRPDPLRTQQWKVVDGLRYRRATYGKKIGGTRIIESEWSKNPKEGISIAGVIVIQGAKDFKVQTRFELDRIFAHCDMFEGYRATRKCGYRGKASPSDAYKPPFVIDTVSDSDIQVSSKRHRSGCAKYWQIIYKLWGNNYLIHPRICPNWNVDVGCQAAKIFLFTTS